MNSLAKATHQISAELGLSIVSDDELLNVFIVLEDIQERYDIDSTEGSSHDLRYKHFTNTEGKQSLTISYSWSTYEEGGGYDLTIDLTTLCYVYKSTDHTVFGDAQNDRIGTLNKLIDCLELLR